MSRAARSLPCLALVATLLAPPLLAAAAPAAEPPVGEPSALPEHQPDTHADAAEAPDDHAGDGDGGHHHDPIEMSPGVARVEHDPSVFRPDPQYPEGYDPEAQHDIYGAKYLVKTARPLLELGRPLYAPGPLEPGGELLGRKNPTNGHLMAYGDLRLALAHNDDGVPVGGETSQTRLAARLNLDLDIGLTGTERFHVFIRPFDQGGSFLRYDIDGKVEDEFFEELDFNIETAFFEGELGEIWRGVTGEENKIDAAFAFGLVPLFTQNGIWIEDAFFGGGFTLPAFSSDALDASNIDLTFFAGFDRVTTTAVPSDDAASVYGMAGFVEANQGYWEFGYGYLDADDSQFSYHNVTVAFTRRYGAFVSNTLRLIGNLGQETGVDTASGALLLVESSLITSKPQVLVPYANFFVGFEQPVAMARAVGAGGPLKNTGINFETDGVTGYPQLDDRGQNAWGGAVGLMYLFDLDRQIVLEVAGLQQLDDAEVPFVDDQYAVGLRFQEPLDNAWILRLDAMHGWRELGPDFYGGRVELRRKF